MQTTAIVADQIAVSGTGSWRSYTFWQTDCAPSKRQIAHLPTDRLRRQQSRWLTQRYICWRCRNRVLDWATLKGESGRQAADLTACRDWLKLGARVASVTEGRANLALSIHAWCSISPLRPGYCFITLFRSGFVAKRQLKRFRTTWYLCLYFRFPIMLIRYAESGYHNGEQGNK